jgi:hypothetical protein
MKKDQIALGAKPYSMLFHVTERRRIETNSFDFHKLFYVESKNSQLIEFDDGKKTQRVALLLKPGQFLNQGGIRG